MGAVKNVGGSCIAVVAKLAERTEVTKKQKMPSYGRLEGVVSAQAGTLNNCKDFKGSIISYGGD